MFGTSSATSQPPPVGLSSAPSATQTRALAPLDVRSAGGLPALPPFPTDPADLRAIEKAQQARVVGPIPACKLQELVITHGTMAKAQVAMAYKFMQESLGMTVEEVASCGQLQVCSTGRDCLLLKFPSIHQADLVNKHKKPPYRYEGG